MTFTELGQRIHKIQELDAAGDFEAAHGEEDKLREDVLRLFADQKIEPERAAIFAGAVLSTNLDDNPKWCA